ncbi:serine/threonine-protein kinase RIO2 [Salinarchaeum laminariae]|uniref:serine/threonine-protein kinase RIO2 n=1 Tax=Salinarchaeum laminariae TaxID=869888 RepID=UPI0020BFD673|nr:serine/threonine-protein kinase RIO2 [Salinarchaeum laminariae]
MVQNVAGIVADLEPEDVHLLSGVEHGMRFSEWVARNKLPDFSGLTTENVDYRLERCVDRELVERKTIQYEGFKLTYEGYDALALYTFAERESITGVGASLGVGKESDVYEVESYRPLALKYHREGVTNFRKVAKERDYTSDHDHVSWLYTARKAAEREFDALETLYPDVSVPQPIDQNRHAIVMAKMDGVELSRTRLEDEQIRGVLELLLDEIQTAYARGYVHGDMSEYNVFVAEDGVTIFDWPQAIPTDHENAEEYLDRDVENVLGYFERKYPGFVGDVSASAIADAIRDDEFESIASLA